MKDSPSPSTEAWAKAIKYCDRCTRRSVTLFSADLTLQELCRDCRDRLKRRREMAAHPAKTKI